MKAIIIKLVKLFIKKSVKLERMEKNEVKGHYISPNFSKMIATQAGNICDFAGANHLGLWEPSNMRNI